MPLWIQRMVGRFEQEGIWSGYTKCRKTHTESDPGRRRSKIYRQNLPEIGFFAAFPLENIDVHIPYWQHPLIFHTRPAHRGTKTIRSGATPAPKTVRDILSTRASVIDASEALMNTTHPEESAFSTPTTRRSKSGWSLNRFWGTTYRAPQEEER